MIENLIRYLKAQRTAFRMLSFPMPEPLPQVGVPKPRPPISQVVDTYVVLAGSRPALACVPVGEHVDPLALSQEIHVPVVEAGKADIPPPYDKADLLPPHGGLMGVPVFLDRRVTAGLLVFNAFSTEDFVEISFDEFVRIEQPRIVGFATSGALPEHASGARAAGAAAV